MIKIHEIGLISVSFFSEILGTLGGFGSSVFFIPIANFFEDSKTVLAITAILHVFGNAIRIWLFRNELDRRTLILFAVPSVILTAIGALGSDHVPQREASLLIGVFLTAFGSFLLLRPKFQISKKASTLVLLSGISGFLTGLVGTGGALRGIGLSALGLKSGVFVTTSSAIDIGGDVLRAWIYLSKGYLGREHLFYIPILFFSALAGDTIASKILLRLSEQRFKFIVLVLIWSVGVATLVRAMLDSQPSEHLFGG